MKTARTIGEYVFSSETQSISDWVKQIEKDGYKVHEIQILVCASENGKII